MVTSDSARTRVFISYSHKDKRYLEKFRAHLASSVQQGELEIWDDTRIEPGSHWEDEIKQAIASAKVFILLVSADFMASEYIMENELPSILDAVKQGEVTVLTVFVSPSAYRLTDLAQFQAFNPPSRPLSKLPQHEREAVWSKLAKTVNKLVAKEPLPSLSSPAETRLLTYSGHTRAVYAVAWSPDGQYIASAGDDQTVQVWNATTGDTIITYRGHSDWVRAVAWSPDGQYIASAGADRTVQVWNATTGDTIITYRGHSDWVRAVAWSPDGQYIASAGADRTVQVWNATTGDTIITYRGHSDWVRAVAWSPDGQYIASAGADRTVQVWNIATAEAITVYLGHPDDVRSVAWSPDGQYIASAGADGTIQVWVWNISGERRVFTGPSGREVTAIAWSPDGQYIASANDDGIVQIWSTTTGSVTFTYQGHSDEVCAVAWSPNKQPIASASGDTTVQVWQIGEVFQDRLGKTHVH